MLRLTFGVMPLFPTRRWMSELEDRLNESDEFQDLRQGLWTFEEEVQLTITDMPLDGTQIRDLPDKIRDEVPKSLRDETLTLDEILGEIDHSIEQSLPIRFRSLIEQYRECVTDGEIHVLFRVKDEVEIEIVDEKEDVPRFEADCESIQELVEGRSPVVATITGDLEPKGVGIDHLQHGALLTYVGKIAQDIDTTFLYEDPDLDMDIFEFAVDATASWQQFWHRQITGIFL